MDRAELAARLSLRALPGLRDAAINRLIREHGSAVRALRAQTQLLELGARSLPDEHTRGRVATALAAIDRYRIGVITPDDPLYPGRLARRLDRAAPPLLFTIGDSSLLKDAGIAIVGSRAMSEYGRMMAEDFVRDLASCGLCIISGLAKGIDAAAHQAALEARGATIAVLGNGVDVTYPPVNARLRTEIARRGLLLSQYLPGERPAPYHFPERNLLLAALATGVVVIEAGKKSGALITAQHAADLNTYAMAVPGAVGKPGSAGVNQLIREGAVCVTSAAEVLETIDREGLRERLSMQRARYDARAAVADADAARVDGSQTADMGESGGIGPGTGDRASTDARAASPNAVLDVLGSEAMHVDDIAAAACLSPAATLAALLELELSGGARQHPGARFTRRRAANPN